MYGKTDPGEGKLIYQNIENGKWLTKQDFKVFFCAESELLWILSKIVTVSHTLETESI